MECVCVCSMEIILGSPLKSWQRLSGENGRNSNSPKGLFHIHSTVELGFVTSIHSKVSYMKTKQNKTVYLVSHCFVLFWFICFVWFCFAFAFTNWIILFLSTHWNFGALPKYWNNRRSHMKTGRKGGNMNGVASEVSEGYLSCKVSPLEAWGIKPGSPA